MVNNMAKKKVAPKPKNQIGNSGEMVGSPITGKPMIYIKMAKKPVKGKKKC
jgi:hypothetical protein